MTDRGELNLNRQLLFLITICLSILNAQSIKIGLLTGDVYIAAKIDSVTSDSVYADLINMPAVNYTAAKRITVQAVSLNDLQYVRRYCTAPEIYQIFQLLAFPVGGFLGFGVGANIAIGLFDTYEPGLLPGLIGGIAGSLIILRKKCVSVVRLEGLSKEAAIKRIKEEIIR